MSHERRQRVWSAILFALPWPLPVYAMSGSALIVINERVLGRHVFDASRIADAAALTALLGAAAWAESHHPGDPGDQPGFHPPPPGS